MISEELKERAMNLDYQAVMEFHHGCATDHWHCDLRVVRLYLVYSVH